MESRIWAQSLSSPGHQGQLFTPVRRIGVQGGCGLGGSHIGGILALGSGGPYGISGQI